MSNQLCKIFCALGLAVLTPTLQASEKSVEIVSRSTPAFELTDGNITSIFTKRGKITYIYDGKKVVGSRSTDGINAVIEYDRYGKFEGIIYSNGVKLIALNDDNGKLNGLESNYGRRLRFIPYTAVLPKAKSPSATRLASASSSSSSVSDVANTVTIPASATAGTTAYDTKISSLIMLIDGTSVHTNSCDEIDNPARVPSTSVSTENTTAKCEEVVIVAPGPGGGIGGGGGGGWGGGGGSGEPPRPTPAQVQQCVDRVCQPTTDKMHNWCYNEPPQKQAECHRWVEVGHVQCVAECATGIL